MMSQPRKATLLCIVLHIYIALSALVFQRCEHQAGTRKALKLPRMILMLEGVCNVTTERASKMVDEILNARAKDRSNEMSESWNDFASSVWFVMTLFTTVGTGHIVPQTFSGRLFCMLSSLFGIPLYALFLKHAGDCIINLLQKFIHLFESKVLQKGSSPIKYMNIKILIAAFLLMTAVIMIGAIGSFAFKWAYFEGIYFCFISLSTVGFGDLVPKIENSTERKVFSCIYMLFNIVGLTIVSSFITSLINSMEDINILYHSFKAKYFRRKIFSQDSDRETGCPKNSAIVGE